MCAICDKGFKHKQLLQRHSLVHSDDRPFICDVCGATFKTRANLYNHSNIHNEEKPFQCTYCDAKFSHKTSLILHTRWHTGEKPYTCTVCGKSFSQVMKPRQFQVTILTKDVVDLGRKSSRAYANSHRGETFWVRCLLQTVYHVFAASTTHEGETQTTNL